ncbi:hypothetical protein [Roseburia sp. OM04-15AA]|uniref:hypothetical protein n=1 Tax=Roseburia sp. OM04-15AA TaxID=2293143 RepID=UPI000E4B4DEA|nr:hypothetical protein [Roseburia sp. OM04-15AA]RHV43485.1 hypothetical protein DXB49_00440 [Roseburia sp. OM04-15AA]
MTGKANETTKRTPVANRKFKDTVFRMLFSDKEALLSLYNAVNNSHYTDSGALEIVTLENAIYMGMKNDLAFILDMNLYLYEHQSTMNPNIPLRDLFYIAAEYQKLVDKKSLYSSALQKIPNPHFIVFYNGSTPIDDCYTSRLSDAFYHATGNPSLELIVTTFNVNAGHNTELMSHCQILNEYSIYVAKVRSFAEQMPLDDAVQKAVTECIQENILADFLRKNQAEVIAMSIFEYDKVEEEKKLRKAEFDAGVEQGLKQASTDTALRLLKTGKFDAKEIAKLCNLSIEEVNQLNNQK